MHQFVDVPQHHGLELLGDRRLAHSSRDAARNCRQEREVKLPLSGVLVV
jgi:hypothetical protein